MSDVAPDLSERDLADLAALADGTLPAERRAEVEARVAASPELRELVERQRRAVAATLALEREPEPESLRAAVEARRRAKAGRRAGQFRGAPRLALVGALALVVAVVASVVLSGGPGAPTVAEAARLAALPSSAAAPPPSGQGGAALAADVDGVSFPDLLPAFGWQAAGLRRDRLDGRTATTVFYEKGSRRIAYVIVSGDGLPRPSLAQKATRGGVLYQTLRPDGRLVVTWRRDGRTCILVGAVPREQLLELAAY